MRQIEYQGVFYDRVETSEHLRQLLRGVDPKEIIQHHHVKLIDNDTFQPLVGFTFRGHNYITFLEYLLDVKENNMKFPEEIYVKIEDEKSED